MSRVPSKSECETLSAIARTDKGSWELISTPDAEACIRNGWVARG